MLFYLFQNIYLKFSEINMETNWNQYFFDFIVKHIYENWQWKGLSQNPNITMDIVETNPDKPWDWFMLSYNKFTKEKEMFKLRVKYQKFVQEHLFEELVKIYMHPTRIQNLLDMGYSIDELDNVL